MEDHEQQHREHTERFIKENGLDTREAAVIRRIARHATKEDERIVNNMEMRDEFLIAKKWLGAYHKSYETTFM